MKGFKRVLAIAVPVLVLALTPAATAASGPGSFGKNTTTVRVQSAELVIGGAVVTIRYSCFPGGYGPYSTFGNVRMVDTSGNQGSMNWRPHCDDTNQTAKVFVPGKFNPGDAAVQAFVCGFDCNADSREVKLH